VMSFCLRGQRETLASSSELIERFAARLLALVPTAPVQSVTHISTCLSICVSISVFQLHGRQSMPGLFVCCKTPVEASDMHQIATLYGQVSKNHDASFVVQPAPIFV